MNPLLYLLGAFLGVCVTVISLAGLINSTSGKDQTAQHGDRRIVHDTAMEWYNVESYYAYPGWYKVERYDTLEAAQKAKAVWDKIHNAEPPKVIEP